MYFNDGIDKGGHFSALEVPQTLTEELWHWQTQLRQRGVLQ
jgi:hypothetical protein